MKVSGLLLLAVYAMISSSALLLLKVGLTLPSFHLEIRPNLSVGLNPQVIWGVLLYGISFLGWVVLIRHLNVSLAYPVSVGLIQISLMVSAMLLFHQRPSSLVFVGVGLIVLGVALVSIGSPTGNI